MNNFDVLTFVYLLGLFGYFIIKVFKLKVVTMVH